MAQRVGNTYKCMFCKFTDNNPSVVNDHQHGVHDFALVPMTKEELNKLIMFIITKDIDLIGEDLYNRLRQYAKYRIQPPTD